MGFCLICCVITLIISFSWFIINFIDNWGDLIIEDILKLIGQFLLFVLSITGLCSGLMYKSEMETRIEEYEKKMKIVEPIIETNKIVIDGKEYEGKIIDNRFSNFVQLKTKEETLIIVEPKSITIKN
jgi:hypothetical protein